jgi:hypothetical protein
MIGATLLGGYLQGRAARQQANAQAAQAQANADIAYNNAQKLQEQAEKQAQNNEINEENKRRRLLQLQGQQRANIGAAGITASGSALAAMADSQFNQEQELAFERYNARQQVDNIFQQSTDNLNQGDIYASSARAYRKAGKRAMMNSMLQAGLSVAANLYSAKSIGALKAGASGLKDYSIGGFTKMSGLPASTGGGITSYGTSYGNAAGWEKMKW